MKDNYTTLKEEKPLNGENNKAKRGFYVSHRKAVVITTIVCAVIIVEGLALYYLGKCGVKEGTLTNITSSPDFGALSGSQKPWQNLRLPGNLIPIHYVLDIRPILEKNIDEMYLFFGSVTITYKCAVPTKFVILHSSKLNYTIDDVSIKNQDESAVGVTDVMFYKPNQFVVIETDQECTKGEVYTLTVSEFVAELDDDLDGLYRSRYKTRDGTEKIIAVTQMETRGARKTFPCFDEPALKATFTITLWYKANTGYYAVSNMPANSYQEKSHNNELWKGTTFDKTLPMSSYLLALVVCDYSYVESVSKSGVQVRVYAREEAVDTGLTNYASDITPKIIDFFENLLSVRYPLPKSDQLAVKDFAAGAMENWGLVIYHETALLYRDTYSAHSKTQITNVIAHELAHQWFGNLVSPAWWDDVWLNEGFASYFSYLAENEIQPTWKSMDIFIPDELQAALEIDAYPSSHPLVPTVKKGRSIDAMFNVVTYSKGASILHMISEFMGKQNFIRGLEKYLKDLAYSTATSADLFSHLENEIDSANIQLPAELSSVLNSWAKQKGYPVVNVFKKDGTNEYHVTQERFLLHFRKNENTSNRDKRYAWYVPFTFQTSEQLGIAKFTQTWLEPDSEPLTFTEEDFVLANINVVGYYRVNYDTNTWRKLIAKLKSNEFSVIPTRNRAQLMDDAFAMVRAGRLNGRIFIDLTSYLIRERSFIPWVTFFSKVVYIEKALRGTSSFDDFHTYVRKLIVQIYEEIGWMEHGTNDDVAMKRQLSGIIVSAACSFGNQHCVHRARMIFQQWMNNSREIVNPDYRLTVYCTAVHYGGYDEWDFVRSRLKNERDQWERIYLRYALGCSKFPWLLKQTLYECLEDDTVKNRELKSCVTNVGRHDYGRDIAWSFLVNNKEALKKRIGEGKAFGKLIKTIAGQFSTEYDLQMLRNLMNATPESDSTRLALSSAIEQTETNVRWKKQYLQSIQSDSFSIN